MPIRILPNDLVNKIAAGEVAERPASVVKELIENSLDAGATEIVVDIIDGGRTLISVADNGRGMDREDLAKSILRHATSKLPDDDLLNINFMGFRGEALPSIASVSDMTIETNGMSMDASTSNIKSSSYESGTKIKVKNLFGNTPARLKFLRSDRVEMMAVVDIVKRLALTRPDVGFNLNNKWVYKASAPLVSRMTEIIGSDSDGNMVEIDGWDGEVHLHGFVSLPTLRRASGIDQYLFVNRRAVTDKIMVGALRAAYFDVMHAREFPLCCLYIDLPNGSVDVNVSPSKTSVHFLEPSRIRDFIVRSIRRKISSSVPSSDIRDFDIPNVASATAASLADFPAFFSPDIHSELQLPQMPLGYARAQIGNKYILAENNEGLIIIDQHAAHERIVYESLRKGDVKRQILLVPAIIKLKPEQVSAVILMKQDLASAGLVIEPFGSGDIAIYEKPADFDLDWDKCLADMADEVSAVGYSSVLLEKLHLKLANYACHHSVRAGQKLSLEQMNALLRQIEETERGEVCNHGRPVWKKFSFSELDSVFLRI